MSMKCLGLMCLGSMCLRVVVRPQDRCDGRRMIDDGRRRAESEEQNRRTRVSPYALHDEDYIEEVGMR